MDVDVQELLDKAKLARDLGDQLAASKFAEFREQAGICYDQAELYERAAKIAEPVLVLAHGQFVA